MVSRAADGPERPYYIAPRAEPATDVIGVPGTSNCFAVQLDGETVGLAIWDAHARAFHAINDRNERLPGSYDDEHSAADAVLDAREIERLEDGERFPFEHQ